MSHHYDPIELLELLDWQVETSLRHIAGTVITGLLAGCLIVFGEHSLERARPLFSVIDQNYGMWQNGFGFVTILIGFVWVAAMMQKVNLYLDCVRKRNVQQRVVDQLRAKEAAQEERRRQREQERAEREALANEPALAGGAMRKRDGSNRFDY
ncbi:hypothetical protein GCM10027277_50910 [Pseudoduganella ginsengisoli]|uniref:Uncharacterized protein n=1 Tax=Pseudoduganella ginsengisoli TaxID=1462440 RepID=A0A6L6Q8R6_9BURK|nr:hypothetical protein [Pseudoduganella ginsengisoli]MTW06025.1 hypothetical protein [Pseudoduganella ginsengisoli]